jgi:hypothetical protein
MNRHSDIYIYKKDEINKEDEENYIPITGDHNSNMILGYISKGNIFNINDILPNHLHNIFKERYSLKDKFEHIIINGERDFDHIIYKEENRQDKRKIKKEDEYNKKINNKSYSFNNNIYMNPIIKKIQYKKRRKL